MKKLLLPLLIFMLLSCNNRNETEVAVFFNPGSSLKTNKFHITVFENNQLYLDTIIQKELKFDEDILLKCSMVSNVKQLIVSINNKKQILHINPQPGKNCLSVWTRYNDRMILRSLFESFTKKSIKETGVIPDYKAFLDSVTVHGTRSTVFDSLVINTKQGKCPTGRGL